MRIGIPCLFYFSMSESPGDLLDIDSFIGQQGSMTVFEIMDSYSR